MQRFPQQLSCWSWRSLPIQLRLPRTVRRPLPQRNPRMLNQAEEHGSEPGETRTRAPGHRITRATGARRNRLSAKPLGSDAVRVRAPNLLLVPTDGLDRATRSGGAPSNERHTHLFTSLPRIEAEPSVPPDAAALAATASTRLQVAGPKLVPYAWASAGSLLRLPDPLRPPCDSPPQPSSPTRIPYLRRCSPRRSLRSPKLRLALDVNSDRLQLNETWKAANAHRP